MIFESIRDNTLVQEHICIREAMDKLIGSSEGDRRKEISIKYSLARIYAFRYNVLV